MSMLDKIRADLQVKLAERSTKAAEIDTILAAAEERDDSSLTEDETTKFNEVRDAVKALDTKIDELEGRESELADLTKRNEEREELSRQIQPAETAGDRQQFRVKSEEPTYHRGSQASFFADAMAWKAGTAFGDVSERLGRHANEVRSGLHGEQRDVSTTALGALVVPNYLPEMFAENLRAGRVTANLCQGLDLPPGGMTMVIPRGTTGTVVAAQTAENQALTEVDFDETTLTVNIRTYGGYNDVSRQAIERGFNTDQILYADLSADYAAKVDAAIINGAGTSGSHTGIMVTSSINSVTVGTATGTAILAKIPQAIAAVNGSRFMAPDVIVMHPRRWGWLASQSDSSGRPLVVPAPSQVNNARGTYTPDYGYVGTLQGLPVYTDANVPTTVSTSTITGATEDNIIIFRRADALLWENQAGGAPRQFRFDDVGSGTNTIRLSVLDESAFTAGWYPTGFAVISGSGLTTPVYP